MNSKKKLFIACGVLVVILGVIIIILAMQDGVNMKMGYVGNSAGNNMNGSFKYFNGTEEKKVKFEEGSNVVITYSLNQKAGELRLTVSDSQGGIIDSADGTAEGEFHFTADKTQKYVITVEAKKAEGSFNIDWEEN